MVKTKPGRGSIRSFVVSVLLLLCPVTSVVAANWPTWRGRHGNGVSSESGLPLSWSEDENVAWMARLGGLGLSTPIVFGDRIFVTSQAGRGRVREGNHPTDGACGSIGFRPIPRAESCHPSIARSISPTRARSRMGSVSTPGSGPDRSPRSVSMESSSGKKTWDETTAPTRSTGGIPALRPSTRTR